LRYIWNTFFYFSILLATSLVGATDRQVISLGTGGVTGVYYPTGGGICRIINRARTEQGIRCAVQATEGSISNILRVLSGELTLGIAQSNQIFHSVNKQSSQGRSPRTSLRTLLGLYPEYFTVIVRKQSPIKLFDDIKGTKINIGKVGSSLHETMTDLMQKKGWLHSDFDSVLNLESEEQASALCEGRIDVMIYTVGHPSGAVREATQECESRIIEVADEQVEQLLGENSYYRQAKIPGAIYRGNIKSVQTIGVNAMLIAHSQLSEETAYVIVKTLIENLEQFRQLHPAFARLDPEAMTKGPFAAPLHKGALRYFKETGLIE
jgi:TRAP transporter TAXI family solute receptor